ncbi:MAG: copper chaperone PCu(A)C [Acidiferrobacterales bacterium]
MPAPEPVATGSVIAERAWVETGKEDAIMLSAFATLKSDASERWVLKQVTARYFRAAMIHRTVLQDGEPRMVLQSSLYIRPGETVAMTKEGYHLMFIGPRKKFKPGDKVRVVFHFEDQTQMKVNFPVLKKAPK